jgi:hypothetical protein
MQSSGVVSFGVTLGRIGVSSVARRISSVASIRVSEGVEVVKEGRRG